MHRAEIVRQVKDVCDDLPRLPEAVAKIMQLVDDAESSVDAIVAAIEPDPNLTTKILRAANSAFYGFSRAIYSLRRAVPLVGLNTIRSLALSIGTMESFPRAANTPGFSRDQLWQHSLAVASGLNRLGQKLGLEADYLFLLGFLHDLGQLVLDKYFSAEFQRCIELAQEQGIALCEAEREVLELDHGEVGFLLLNRWHFPEVIIQPVKLHHSTKLPKGPDTVDLAMLRVVNSLAHEVGLGKEHDPVGSRINQADLEFLGIKPEGLAEIRDLLASSREEVEALYAAMG